MKRGILHFACRASLVLLPFLCGCEIDDVAYWVDKARCDMRVGILAESHLDPPRSDKVFTAALNYFKAREVDAVIFIGDVTQNGALAQWRNAKKVWDKVFPPDSRVVPIVVTGEMDNAKVFEQLTGEPYEMVSSCEVKGYTFIGANWKDPMGVDAWKLKPYLEKQNREKPFFYIQQLIPYATCCPYEGRIADYDSGKITYMLSRYPNAIAICARSHTPLTDESAFWRDAFTCVNAGSLSCARTRGEGGVLKLNVHNGLVMSVYGSSVVFERMDLVNFEKLGPDWCVKVPVSPVSHDGEVAPQFWDDTRLMIFPSAKTVSVRFPPVLAKHTGVRAYEYEVAVEGQGRQRMLKTVSSPACYLSEARENKAVSCDFSRDDLPTGTVRFSVTPIDAFGRRGRPISAEAQL